MRYSKAKYAGLRLARHCWVAFLTGYGFPRHYYHPLVSADHVLGGVYQVSAVQELLEAPEFSTFRLLPPQYTPALYTTAPHS